MHVNVKLKNNSFLPTYNKGEAFNHLKLQISNDPKHRMPAVEPRFWQPALLHTYLPTRKI